MTHDTSRLPAEACSEFLMDSDLPPSEQTPEGWAIAVIFVGLVVLLSTLDGWWLIASAMSKAALLTPIVIQTSGPHRRKPGPIRRTLRALWHFLIARRCEL